MTSSDDTNRRAVEVTARRVSRRPSEGRRRRRPPAIVPISLPRIPESLFPITSQRDLEEKARRFLRKHRFPEESESRPRLPRGHGGPRK